MCRSELVLLLMIASVSVHIFVKIIVLVRLHIRFTINRYSLRRILMVIGSVAAQVSAIQNRILYIIFRGIV